MSNSESGKHPHCYGDLETVFPVAEHGLRSSPPGCMSCVFKTECMRKALKSGGGVKVREEAVDRAYDSGMMGFFERWSKRKCLDRQRRCVPKKKERG